MLNFCSYFDKNYLNKFLVLRDSLVNVNCRHNFYVLTLDNFTYKYLRKKNFSNVTVCSLKHLEKRYPDLKRIKYNRRLIEYYFTLSPYLPIFLHEEFNLKKLNYLDVDIFFFKNPELFYSKLNNYSVILIKQSFKKKYGLFNVGWISYNFLHFDTIKILNNWRIECTEWCYDKVEKNRYADQKYLDKWPNFSKDLIICEPKSTMISPWDKGHNHLIKNINNFYCYHFQGLKFSNSYFITGIGLYYFNYYRKFIKKFYLNYIFLLKNKQIDENLDFSDNLNLRSAFAINKKLFLKIIHLMKKIKFYVLCLFRMDFYIIK
jgi:hypothetical protein